MGQSLTGEIVATAETATSITCRARVIYVTSLAVSDTANQFTVIGDFGSFGPGSVSISTSSTQVVFENTVVFTKNYGATQTKSMQASLTGINYWGASQVIDIGTVPFTVPARAFDLPAPVTGLSVTRVSDSRQDLAWTNTSPGSSSAPYQSLVVRRRDNVNTAWVTLATIAVTTGFADTTTMPDRVYEYQVFAQNSSGLSASAPTVSIQTTPTQPSGVTATRDGADIVVSFTDASLARDGHEVECQADGGSWVFAAVRFAGVTSYRHVAPAAGSVWKYRVNAFTSSPTLRSAKVESNSVQLAAPPAAPTNLTPSGSAADGTETQTFAWLHVSTDTSAQTKRQLRYRRQGTSTWTEGSQVATSEQSVTIAPIAFMASLGITIANGQALEWQVRTWGTHTDPSPWSATATLSLSARPTVTISTPGSTVNTSALTVAFAYYDAEGTPQSQYRAQLLNAAGAVLEEQSGAGTTASVTFATPVADGLSYTTRVQVADASGLWSPWASQAFTVTYLPPANVDVSATFDDVSKTVVISLTPTVAVSGSTVTPTSVTVERSIDDGSYRPIVKNVAPNATLLDAAPTLHGVNRYRVTVYSALPSSSVMTPVAVTTTERRWAVLSTGPGWSRRVYLWADIDRPATYGRDKALVEYHGRDFPVEYAGTMQTHTIKVSAKLTADSSTEAELIALAATNAPVLWRDPDGRHVVCSLSPVSISTPDAAGVQAVSFTLTRVDSYA